MKSKIVEQLKHLGSGYELDKLPVALLNSVVEATLPIIEKNVRKAEDRAIQKTVNERFVAKVLKTTLEGKAPRCLHSAKKAVEIAKD